MNAHLGNPVPELNESLRLLNSRAVSLILGISERYVALLAQRGEIEHYRFGKSLRFSLTQVITYLDACRKGAEETDALETADQ